MALLLPPSLPQPAVWTGWRRYAGFGGGSRAMTWKVSGCLADLEKQSHGTSPGDGVREEAFPLFRPLTCWTVGDAGKAAF